jgi:hypothetical protein
MCVVTNAAGVCPIQAMSGAALSWKRQLIQDETVESRVSYGFPAD